MIENNIRGIQLKSMKSRSVEDVGESVRLDVQMEFSEIYVSAYRFKLECLTGSIIYLLFLLM